MNKQDLLACWANFRSKHQNVSVDRMICDPVLRMAFLESLGSTVAKHSEKELLWAPMSLRKRKELFKR